MEKKRILLIEDKEVVGQLIRDILISTGRYEVICADDGYGGIRKIIGDDKMDVPHDEEKICGLIDEIASKGLSSIPTARTFDLVLSDVRMPGIDGITLLKMIRKICPEQVSVLITGYGLENRQDDIDEAGPSAILKKPLTNDELIHAIDSACGVTTTPFA